MKLSKLTVIFVAAFCATVACAQDQTVQTLQRIADTPGPPGFEEPIRKVMVDYMKPLSQSLRYDGMGSIIAVQGASGPRVMVDAHMDELGGMVRRVTPKGSSLCRCWAAGWTRRLLTSVG